MRRLLILYLSAILLTFGVPQSRAFVFQQRSRPEVQAFLDASVAKGAVARQTVLAYAQSQLSVVSRSGAKTVITTSGGQVELDTSDDWGLSHGCSLAADEVDAVLKGYNSPAFAEGGFGQMSVEACKQYRIDNAYVLAMFIHESTAGTAGVAVSTHGTGNVKCTDGNCFQGFQVYPDWKTGGQAHFALLAYYRDKLGDKTIVEALNRWAPPEDNNNQAQDCDAQLREGRELSYPCAVKKDVSSWRAANAGKVVAQGNDGPVAVQQPVTAAPAGSYQAPPLALEKCLGTNVRSAHNSSPGLHDVTVKPGESWSFDANWVINGDGQGVDCGVYYGGVCNQASRWSNVARHLGLSVESVYHGKIYDADVDQEDNISIWSDGQWGGVNGQDVIIKNTLSKTLRIVASIDGNSYNVKGWLE